MKSSSEYSESEDSDSCTDSDSYTDNQSNSEEELIEQEEEEEEYESPSVWHKSALNDLPDEFDGNMIPEIIYRFATLRADLDTVHPKEVQEDKEESVFYQASPDSSHVDAPVTIVPQKKSRIEKRLELLTSNSFFSRRKLKMVPLNSELSDEGTEASFLQGVDPAAPHLFFQSTKRASRFAAPAAEPAMKSFQSPVKGMRSNALRFHVPNDIKRLHLAKKTTNSYK